MAFPGKKSAFGATAQRHTGPVAPVNLPSPTDHNSDLYYTVFLEQIAVSGGVFRKEMLCTADDLVVGDEYLFPNQNQQACSEIMIGNAIADVHLLSKVEVGKGNFGATRTHDIVLMSEFGRVIKGYVLAIPGTRSVIALQRPAEPDADYTLISMSDRQSADATGGH